MAKMNELAIIDTSKTSIVPSAEDLSAIMEELKDMDRMPYGRIKIAPGGAGVFKVQEPGDEDTSVAQTVEGVIILSPKTNGLWLQAFGGENKAPDCASINGEDGLRADTGEWLSCAECPYNQFGSDKDGQGRGKACKNMRRLYIMRPGDIFPMVLTLPPTALKAYDNYRTKVMLGRKKLIAVMTRISLKTEKNKDGIEFSSPVFEAIAILPPNDAKALEQYATPFNAAAQRMSVTVDDYTQPQAVEVETSENPFTQEAAPAPAPEGEQQTFTTLD